MQPFLSTTPVQGWVYVGGGFFAPPANAIPAPQGAGAAAAAGAGAPANAQPAPSGAAVSAAVPANPGSARSLKPDGGAQGGKGGKSHDGAARSAKPDSSEAGEEDKDGNEAEPRDQGPGAGWDNRGRVGNFVKFERTYIKGNGKERTEYMLLARKGAPASIEARYLRGRRADIGVPNIAEATHIATTRPDITWLFYQENTNHAPADAARLQATILAIETMTRHDRAVTVLDVGGSIGTWVKTHAPLGTFGGGLSVHVITDEVVSRGAAPVGVPRSGMVTSCRFDCEDPRCRCRQVVDYIFMRDVDWYPTVLGKALSLAAPRAGYRVVTTYAMREMFFDHNKRPTMRNDFEDGRVYCRTDGPGGRACTYVNEDTRAWLDDGKRDWTGNDGEDHVLYVDRLAAAGPVDDQREQMLVLELTVDRPARPNQPIHGERRRTVRVEADAASGVSGGTISAPASLVQRVESAAVAKGSGGRLHEGAVRAAAYAAGAEVHAEGDVTIEELEAAVAISTDRLMRARTATAGLTTQREADTGVARTAMQEPARAVEGSLRLRYRRMYKGAEDTFRETSGLALVWPFIVLALGGIVIGVPSGRKSFVPGGRQVVAAFLGGAALLYMTYLIESARYHYGWIVPAAVAVIELFTHSSSIDLGDDTEAHERLHLGGPFLAGVFAWVTWMWPGVFCGKDTVVSQFGSAFLLMLHVSYNAQAWATMVAVYVRGYRYHDAMWPSDPMGRAFAAAATNWVETREWLLRLARPNFRVVRAEGGVRIPPRPGRPGVAARRTQFTRYKPVTKAYSVGLPALCVGFLFLAMMPGMVVSDVNAMVAHRAQVEHNEPPLPEYRHSPVAQHFDLPRVAPQPIDELDFDPKQAKVFEEPDDQQPHAYEGSCKVEHTMKPEGEGVARLVVAVARSAREGVISAARALHQSLTQATHATLEGGRNLVYGHGLNPVEVAAAHALCSDAEFVVETDGKAYDDHEKLAAAVAQNNVHEHVSGVRPVPLDPVTIKLPGGATLEHTGPVRVTGRDDTGCGNAVTNLEGQVHALVSGVFGAARHVRSVSKKLIDEAASSVGATLNRGAESAITMAQFAQLSLTTSGRSLLDRLKATFHWAAGDDGLVVVRQLGILTKVGRDEFFGAVVAAWHFRGHPVTGGLVSWQMATFCSQRFYPCDPFVYTNHAMSIRVYNFPGPLVSRALYKLTSTFLSAKITALRGMMANDAKARLRGAAHVPFVRVALQWMVTRWGKHDKGIGLPATHQVFGELPEDFTVGAPVGEAGEARMWDFFAAVYGDDYAWEVLEAEFALALDDFDPDGAEVGIFDTEWMARLGEVDKGSPKHPEWCA